MNNMKKTEKIDKITKTIKIIYKANDTCANQLKKKLYNAAKYLEEFYEIKVPKTTIELVYSRKEFEKKTHYINSPEWLVAIAKKNKIFLVSPSAIEKISCHKKSKVKKIITHELCHIFNNKINRNMLMWVDEGIAQFIAGQKKKKDFTKNNLDLFTRNLFDNQINLATFSKNNGYKISYWIANEIVKDSGRNGLSRLMKISSKNGDTRLRQKLQKIIKALLFTKPIAQSYRLLNRKKPENENQS